MAKIVSPCPTPEPYNSSEELESIENIQRKDITNSPGLGPISISV
jgi:hypothetical protein